MSGHRTVFHFSSVHVKTAVFPIHVWLCLRIAGLEPASIDDTVMSGSVPDRITSVFTEVPPEGSEILAQRILQLPRICRYYYIAQMMRSSKSLQFYSEEERSAVLNLCLSKMLLLYSVCYFSRALLRHVAAAVVRMD